LAIWHVSRYPIYGYQGGKIVFDGLRVYGDLSVLNECCNYIWYGDYFNLDAVITRSTIVGIDAVVLPYFGAGITRVDNSFIAATSGIVNRTSGAPGSCPNCNMPDRTQVIQNVRFAALPGKALRTITMDYETHGGYADWDSKDQVFVYDYQGQAGAQFQVYYKEQATQNIAGGLAPCQDTATRSEVYGITCALSGTAPPPTYLAPAPPTSLRITR
jgi:hypothetical protein